MADIDRLRQTLDYIKANPQNWDQSAWAALVTPTTRDADGDLVVCPFPDEGNGQQTICGTAYCFAGHVTLNAGYRPIFNKEQAEIVGDQARTTAWQARNNFGEVVAIDSFAREWLDLTYEEARHLFQGQNTLDVLEHMINNLASGDDIIEGLYSDPEDDRWRIGEPEPEKCDCCGQTMTTE